MFDRVCAVAQIVLLFILAIICGMLGHRFIDAMERQNNFQERLLTGWEQSSEEHNRQMLADLRRITNWIEKHKAEEAKYRNQAELLLKQMHKMADKRE